MDWRKATKSGLGECVQWRKAEKSWDSGCVEVASTREEIWIGDSKRPEDGHQVTEPKTWTSFLTDIKAGKFDL